MLQEHVVSQCGVTPQVVEANPETGAHAQALPAEVPDREAHRQVHLFGAICDLQGAGVGAGSGAKGHVKKDI